MDVFNSIDVRNRFFQGDLLWTGYPTTFIPYVRLKRTIGRSQYNFGKKLAAVRALLRSRTRSPERLLRTLAPDRYASAS
jgi:dolichol-phosphate mannosyltransferase